MNDDAGGPLLPGGGDEQRQQRLRKLAALREAGVEPFAIRFDRSHLAADAIAEFEEREKAAAKDEETRFGPVSVAGRVTRHRSQGKVAFADVVDGSGKLQIYARLDALGEAGMRLVNDLDLGDIVGASGEVFRTRRGEVSLDVAELTLLTKALRPLPDKWHGLKDPEIRFRQRHVDLIVNPDARRLLKMRSRLIRHLHAYLDDRGFEEVETPVLHRLAGGAAARPFLTHHNALDLDLALRIALELHLKRLVVGGMERVYEIGRVFRNEGVDRRHNPEFTLLELYQAYTDLDGMMELTEAMLRAATEAVLGGTEVVHGEETIDLGKRWDRQEMLDLVAGANPDVDLQDEDAIRRRAIDIGAVRADTMDWGELIFELFERSVESELVRPTFVTGFPISVSPLARRRVDDPRLAERFELFIAGQELANAFAELTDPIDQRARFEQQLALRDAGGEETHPMDEDFIAALEQGMPPTGGLGIGIDRLVMLLASEGNIREVIAFPLLRDAPASPGEPGYVEIDNSERPGGDSEA
ncbi:MAG: lysine--tRNA ligase [Candidatus Dormiibacterota bacterium]